MPERDAPYGTRAEGYTIMRKLMSRLAIASMIGLPVAAAMTVPAGAATGTHVRVVSVSRDAGPQTVPKSKIHGQGSTATYNPTALTVAEDPSGMCTGFVSFKIRNTGTKNAFITVNGTPFFKLPPASTLAVCASGGSAGDQYTVGLSNKANTVTYASKLTITLSD